MSDRRLKEAFDNVHADDEIKRRTREFLARKTGGYRRGTVFPYRRLAAVMACLLLMAIGWGGYFLYFIPVSSISVDVNPSIELGINRFDRVVKVDAYNDDGYHIMSSLDVRFMDYRDAMDVILNQESEEAYLAEDSCIAIAVSGAAEGKLREMLAHLHTCASSYGNVHCSTGSHGEVAAAHEAGMTLGRYQAFLKLQALDSSITAEDIEGLTISQIWDKIAELSGDTENVGQNGDTAKDTPEGQNGCGIHRGNAGQSGNTGQDEQTGQNEADAQSGNAGQNGAGTQSGNAGQNGAGTQDGTQDACRQNGHHGGHGHGHSF